MPTACRMGCPNDARTCPEHGKKATQRTADRWRGSAASRGYDRHWQTFVEQYRQEQFRLNVDRAGLCGSRLPTAPLTQDSDCARLKRTAYGRIADHIIPITGKDDPRRLDPSNIQLLCDGQTGFGCHDRKRQREARA
jgi:hypothetical protein